MTFLNKQIKGVSIIWLILAAGLTAWGLASLAGAWRSYARDQAFFTRAVQVTGRLTAYVPDPIRGGTGVCPSYDYRVPPDKTFQFIVHECSDAPDTSRLGQTIQIYYDPESPILSARTGHDYFSPAAGALSGLALLAIALAPVLRSWLRPAP